MKFQRAAGFLAIGFAVVSLYLLGAPVFAQKPFMVAAAEHFNLVQAIKSCKLCHGATKGPSKTNLNDFGKTIQADDDMKPLLNKKVGYEYSADEIKILLKVMDKLADKDADGDGATNGEEMALGTGPGDAKTTPAAADLEKYRKEHPKK
jgi:hypothetical protein